MHSIKFGILVLLILIVSAASTSGLSFYTIYNPYTGKLDYYAISSSSDNWTMNNLTLNYIKLTKQFDPLLGYNNLTKCSDTQILKMSGTSWTCAADAAGGASGTNYWQVGGEWMWGNITSGGKNNLNITVLNVSTIYLDGDMALGWLNLTGVPAIGNTTAEIIAVINSNPTGNTTAEILAVIQANPSGNSTSEIQSAINDSHILIDYLKIGKGTSGIGWLNLTNVPAIGNTTDEIIAVINTNPTGNTTAEIIAVIAANPTGNTTAEIQTVIAANPTGNTTAEIQTAINGSDITLMNLYLTQNLVNLLGYNNLTKCSDTQILKMSGASWACAADAAGGASGTNYWQVLGEWMFPNATAGGKPNINITTLNATTSYIHNLNAAILNFTVGNTTAEIQTVIAANPTGNTTAEIQTVIAANPTGNTTAEIQAVIAANPTGNTTAEIQAVVAANPTGNTTSEIQAAINSSHISLALLDLSTAILLGNTNLFGWSNLTSYPSACAAGSAISALGDTLTCSSYVTGNTTAEIQVVIAANPTGNTTTQIQTAINDSHINLTFLNVTNMTTGDDTARLYWNGSCNIITGPASRLELC